MDGHCITILDKETLRKGENNFIWIKRMCKGSPSGIGTLWRRETGILSGLPGMLISCNLMKTMNDGSKDNLVLSWLYGLLHCTLYKSIDTGYRRILYIVYSNQLHHSFYSYHMKHVDHQTSSLINAVLH